MQIRAMKIRVAQCVEHSKGLLISVLQEEIEALKHVAVPLEKRTIAGGRVDEARQRVRRGDRATGDLSTKVLERVSGVSLLHESARGGHVPMSLNCVIRQVTEPRVFRKATTTKP